MKNLVKFETAEMKTARLDRELNRAMQETVEKMDAVIQSQPNDRVKLEAQMLKAIATGDDAEFERTSGILQQMNTKKIQVIKGGKN